MSLGITFPDGPLLQMLKCSLAVVTSSLMMSQDLSDGSWLSERSLTGSGLIAGTGQSWGGQAKEMLKPTQEGSTWRIRKSRSALTVSLRGASIPDPASSSQVPGLSTGCGVRGALAVCLLAQAAALAQPAPPPPLRGCSAEAGCPCGARGTSLTIRRCMLLPIWPVRT